jgi:hypothetical protein
MRSLIFTRSLVAVCLASGLAACGGGGDSSPAVSTVPAIDAAAVSTLNSSFNSGLVALTTYAGLQNTALFDLFAATFLDAGSTKAMVQSNLSQDAIALATTADMISFPGLAFSNAVVSNCNASNVCTLTGTLTNKDADVTEASFSTQVLYSNGKYLLLGDQASS